MKESRFKKNVLKIFVYLLQGKTYKTIAHALGLHIGYVSVAKYIIKKDYPLFFWALKHKVKKRILKPRKLLL